VTGRLQKFLSSRKLALTLLLLFSVSAIPGTFFSAETVQRAGLYRNPFFVTLLIALCLNISFCTWHRFSRVRTSSGGSKRVTVMWLDLLLHTSIIIILAGGAGKALWGFVGTQYLFVNVETSRVYDPATDTEVPLGFTVLMKERVEEYYPLLLRLGVKDAASGAKLALVELQERKEGSVPGGNVKLTFSGYVPPSGDLFLSVTDEEGRREFPLNLHDEERREVTAGAHSYVIVSFKKVLRKVRGRVAIIDGGVEVKEDWIEVNRRVAYRGTSLFQTAWGVDPYGNRFISIQVSRDPSAPVFWAGCVAFSLLLPLYFYARHRRD
jgi:cytochrome c biogenesis protein ResB